MTFKQLTGALAFAALLYAPAGADAATELNMQVYFGPTQALAKDVFIPWVNELKEKTNGELIVHMQHGAAVVAMNQTDSAVRDGLLDIATWNAAVSPKQYPHLTVSATPNLVENPLKGTAFNMKMYSDFEEVKKEVERPGIPIAMWSAGTPQFYSKFPIRKPEDLKGHRIMVIMGSDAKVVEKLGGIPVKVQPPDVYVGLQRGMGDAVVTAAPSAVNLQIQDLVKYITPYCTGAFMLCTINRDSYASIPEASRKVFDESIKNLSVKAAQALNKESNNAVKIFTDAGVEYLSLTEEESAAWSKALDIASDDSFWVQDLKSFGIKDAQAWLKKAEDLYKTIEALPAE